MATVLDEVPLVSMAEQANDPDGFAQKFGQSFRRFGFAMVADHGVPQELIDRAWAMTKAFFELPEAEKRAYFVEGGGGARGYTPFKTEIAKGAQYVDLKEFWHVGRELTKGHRFENDMAPNIWPDRPRASRRRSSSCSRRSTTRATGCSRRSPAISASSPTGSIARCATAIPCCVCSTIRPSPPTRPKCGPARMRTST